MDDIAAADALTRITSVDQPGTSLPETAQSHPNSLLVGAQEGSSCEGPPCSLVEMATAVVKPLEDARDEGAGCRCRALMQEAADLPLLAGKFSRCLKTVQALPAEAFDLDQRHWLAKLIGDYTDYTSTALCIADGIISTREELLEELEREMRIEIRDMKPHRRKRKGQK